MAVTRVLFEHSFVELEKQQLESEIARVTHTISADLNNLNNTTRDWSAWDELYQYSLGNNPDFPGKNITKQSFINNNINYLLIFDNE